MKDNIGPLSKDLVVACAIYHLELNRKQPRYPELTEMMKGRIMPAEIPRLLSSLMDWGIVNTEYTGIGTGRAGRMYYISSEANNMIRELYELYWSKVMK